ncbi:hypothetical protein J0H58_16960 [bacterium]|nr:hypothetical protein [bacterium]
MLGKILIGLGVGMVLIGFLFRKTADDEEKRLAGVEEEPTRLTVAQLIARGVSGPKNVIVSGFDICDDYVVEKRGQVWQGVYLPIVPAAAGVPQPRDRKSDPVRVVVHVYNVQSEDRLMERLNKPDMAGLILGTVADVDPRTQNLLRKHYPVMDPRTCIVITEGATLAPEGGPEGLRVFGRVLTYMGIVLAASTVIVRAVRIARSRREKRAQFA